MVFAHLCGNHKQELLHHVPNMCVVPPPITRVSSKQVTNENIKQYNPLGHLTYFNVEWASP